MVYDGSTQYAGTGWKCTVAILLPLSWIFLKKNSLPVGRTLSSTPACSFCLEREMSRSSAGLEFLVPKEGMLPTGDTTMFLLNWNLRLSPGHLGASHAFEKAKKGVMYWLVWLILITKEEIRLLLYNGHVLIIVNFTAQYKLQNVKIRKETSPKDFASSFGESVKRFCV